MSNEGGRQAQPGDTTMDSYGTAVPADGYLGTSTTGTVSVIDTANPSAAVGSIAVGLHPTAMYLKGNALFVANTNSDTVSVIDTTKDKVVQTIETKPWPSSKVGYAAHQHRDDRATATCWSPSAARTPSPSTSITATPSSR